MALSACPGCKQYHNPITAIIQQQSRSAELLSA